METGAWHERQQSNINRPRTLAYLQSRQQESFARTQKISSYTQGGLSGYAGMGGGYSAPRYEYGFSGRPSYQVLARQETARERYMKEQDRLKAYYANQLQTRELPNLINGLKTKYGGQRGTQILENMQNMMEKNPGDAREQYYQMARARTLLEKVQEAERQQSALENNVVDQNRYESMQGTQSLTIDGVAGAQEMVISNISTDPYKQIRILTPVDAYGHQETILYSPNMDAPMQYNKRRGVQAMRDFGIVITKDSYYDGKTRGVRIKFTKPGTYNVDGHQVIAGKRSEEEEKKAKEEEGKPILKTIDINAPFQVKQLYVIRSGGRQNPIDVSRLKNGSKLMTTDGVTIEKTQDGKLRLLCKEQGTFDVIAAAGERQLKLGRYEVIAMPKKEEKTALPKKDEEIQRRIPPYSDTSVA